MSNLGGDDINFEVGVDGRKGRAELDSVLERIRKIAKTAEEQSGPLDKATVDQANSYKKLAREIEDVIEIQENLDRRQAQTAAARNRATGTGIGNNNAVQQQKNRDLIAEGQLALINDKREEQADNAAYNRLTRERKEREANDRRAQQAIAREQAGELAAVRGVQEELKAQQKVNEARDAAAYKERKLAQASNERIEKAEQKELAAQTKVNRAAYDGEKKRLADSNARVAAVEKADLDRVRKTSRAEYDAEVKAAAAASRNSQGNIYNDYMAHQKDAFDANSVANINATRYALYDVSRTLTVIGLATAAVGVYATATASKFEYAFDGIIRSAQLTGDEIEQVQSQLLDITKTSPVNFEDVTTAAQLGAQMGIYADQLDRFASVTTKFSATTNASIDTTASTFGRLSNLLDVPANKFENLGSAIAKVGVESVATETEILSTTQQIAGAAAVYGFTADQVVGLGAAFSSLAIAPEAARGSVTRIFGDIEKAVATGGPELEEYARIMNTTVQGAAQLWNDDPSQFFTTLVNGLSTSKSLLLDLNSIGANDVRDQNLLQRLAASPEVLAKSLAVSNQAYQEGTYLQEAYATQTDNLQSKVAILVNSLNALAATAGGPLALVLQKGVEILTNFVNAIGNAPPILLAVITGAIGLVGAFILLRAAQAASIAGLLAMQSVLKGLGNEVRSTTISMAGLRQEFTRTKALMLGGVSSVNAVTGSFKGATGAIGGFVKGAGALALVTAALWALGEVANYIDSLWDTSAQKAEKYFGDISGFADAVRDDTKAYNDGAGAIATYQTAIGDTGEKTEDANEAVNTFLGLNTAVASTVGTATDAVADQTIALGDNADAWLRKAFSEQKGIQDLANNPELLQTFTKLGGNITDFIQAGLQGKGEDYIRNLLDPAIDAATKSAEAKLAAIGATGGATQAETDEAYKQAQGFEKLRDALLPAAKATDELVASQQVASNTSALLGIDIANTGDEAEDSAGDVDELKKAVDNLFSGITTEGDFYASLDSLMSALEASGNNFNTFTENGRAAFSALQDTILSTIDYAALTGVNATDALLPLFLTLQQQGVDTTDLLHQLAASPIVYTADIDVSAIAAKLGAVTGGTGQLSGAQSVLQQKMAAVSTAARANARAVSSAGSAAATAAEKVYTLSDYVSDLQGVFSKAFEFRFGEIKTLDDITTKWNSIAEAQEEARESIAQYRIEMQGLEAEKNTLTVQLGVALDYNDATRAQEIQARLAEINAELADKQRDVAKAGEEFDKSLEGNSQNAIDNRGDLLDLVNSYKDYIGSLANSGLSQDELAARVQQLKAQFIQQATQMGYNTQEVQRYAAGFDDLTLAINKVPRNITISADPNPAQRAIDEFLASNRDGRGASSGVTVPFTADTSALEKAGRLQALLAQQAALRAQISNPAQADYYEGKIRAIQNLIDSGNYASGGFVPGRKPIDPRYDNMVGRTSAGRVVGLQGGEPIITNRARSKYGDKMFNDINALRYKPQVVLPQSGGGATRFPDVMTVEFGPQASALIASGKMTTVILDPRGQASAVNGVNGEESRRGNG